MAGMPWPAAVAVSGGGDSLALMHLLADWARAKKIAPPLVLCVDHGLRPESAKEAKTVARWAKKAGLKSEILTVRGKKPKSDIEAWARQARYSLMADRLTRHRLKALYLAHHQDDQAETFLIRLARGSGLDGLSAMRKLFAFPIPGQIKHGHRFSGRQFEFRDRLRIGIEVERINGWNDSDQNQHDQPHSLLSVIGAVGETDASAS